MEVRHLGAGLQVTYKELGYRLYIRSSGFSTAVNKRTAVIGHFELSTASDYYFRTDFSSELI